MLKNTLLALLIIIPAILAAQVTVGDNQKWLESAFSSRFELGNLYKGQVVKFTFQYDSQSVVSIDLYLVATLTSESYKQKLTCVSNPCVATFSSESVDVTGSYFIVAEYTNAVPETVVSGAKGTYVRVGKLTITGDNASRSTPFLVRVTTSIGEYRYHRISLAAAGSIKASAKFASGDTNQEGFVKTSGYIKIIQQSAASGFAISGVNAVAVTPTLNAADPTVYDFQFTNLTAGFYWLLVDITAQDSFNSTQISDSYKNNWQFIISYITTTYVCPYDKSYPDHKNIFGGCVEKSPVTQLPCITFDETTQQCSACYTGYRLVNGRCLVIECAAGQYFDFGVCRDNPTGCTAYNKVDGCTACADTYAIKTDQTSKVSTCERIPLVCGNRTFYNVAKYICDKVSEDCGQYSTIDGRCLSCTSIAKKLVDGVCITAVDNCGPRQYIKSGICYPINPLCQVYERLGGKCNSCIFGYTFDQNGNCVLINCPNGFHPNEYGNCVKVSELCQTYDLKGRCLVCVRGHYPDQNGECLQGLTPYGCQQRQYLGFDNTCHEVSQFCDIWNAEGKYCIKCKGNYYLMEASNTCVPPVSCTGRYYIVNNMCREVDLNCGKWNQQTGRCVTCVDGYDLYYGLCITAYKCGARQWKDGNKKCQDVSSLCGDFNPSTGECITCSNANYNLVNGICCPKGQFNVNGVCQASSSANNAGSNLNGCGLVVPGYGCVTCQNGFRSASGEDGLAICVANN